MLRYRVFDVFATGAVLFTGGVLLTLALDSGPWTRTDTALVMGTVLALWFGGSTLRGLYRSQKAIG